MESRRNPAHDLHIQTEEQAAYFYSSRRISDTTKLTSGGLLTGSKCAKSRPDGKDELRLLEASRKGAARRKTTQLPLQRGVLLWLPKPPRQKDK